MGDRAAALNFYRQAVATANDKSRAENANIAYQLFSSAVTVDPTFAEGWFQLGLAHGEMHWLNAAVACYRRALEVPPADQTVDLTADKRAKALCNMGHQLHHLGRNDEALEATGRSLQFDKRLAFSWLNLSLIQTRRSQAEVALESARRAFDLDESSVVEMGLAFALLFNGKYAAGLTHFEARFPHRLQNFLAYPFPKWHGEPDKTVFLVADQGRGDTLSFSRFVERAAKRAKFIHMGIHPEMTRLFGAMFQHLPNINIIPLPCPFPPAEYWTTFVSLPFALGLGDDEIRDAPGVPMPQFHAGTTWKAPDRDLHVGVAWAGAKDSDIDHWRSIPLVQFLDLCQVPGVQLYSLQADDRSKQIHENGLATVIRDLSPYIRDFADTVAIIRELDLIITVESAPGHIAGACGKECWIPYSHNGLDWRLGVSGENPLWYPSHRCFKQGANAAWPPVFDRIVEALRERVAGVSASA